MLEAAGWLGLASMAVTLLFAYLNRRLDSKVGTLQEQNARQAEQIATLEAAVDSCEARHRTRDDRERDERARIEALERTVAGLVAGGPFRPRP